MNWKDGHARAKLEKMATLTSIINKTLIGQTRDGA